MKILKFIYAKFKVFTDKSIQEEVTRLKKKENRRTTRRCNKKHKAIQDSKNREHSLVANILHGEINALSAQIGRMESQDKKARDKETEYLDRLQGLNQIIYDLKRVGKSSLNTSVTALRDIGNVIDKFDMVYKDKADVLKISNFK